MLKYKEYVSVIMCIFFKNFILRSSDIFESHFKFLINCYLNIYIFNLLYNTISLNFLLIPVFFFKNQNHVLLVNSFLIKFSY